MIKLFQNFTNKSFIEGLILHPFRWKGEFWLFEVFVQATAFDGQIHEVAYEGPRQGQKGNSLPLFQD